MGAVTSYPSWLLEDMDRGLWPRGLSVEELLGQGKGRYLALPRGPGKAGRSLRVEAPSEGSRHLYRNPGVQWQWLEEVGSGATPEVLTIPVCPRLWTRGEGLSTAKL